jgi:nucleoid-associated protein YgaU
MGLVRVGFVLTAVPLLAGCGYVHVGRLADRLSMARLYSDLAYEHQLLRQELATARQEGDTLRAALERASGAANSTDLAQRLDEATRELATLRANEAKLQSEGSAPASGNIVSPQHVAELEAKLASSAREQAQLQEANARLRTELDRARAENATLAESLRSMTGRHEQAQAALAQLNAELSAQKQTRAESATGAAREKDRIAAARETAAPAAVAAARPGQVGLVSLQSARLPRADALATGGRSSVSAELRAPSDKNSLAAPAAAKKTRTHVVKTGDTLEKIARQYYGTAERWPAIYDANATALSSGQPLRAGTELQIPEN